MTDTRTTLTVQPVQSPAAREGNAVGYQTCPKCGGQGFVAKPPWVAGDQYLWSDNGTSNYSCPVCHGAKVIVRPS